MRTVEHTAMLFAYGRPQLHSHSGALGHPSIPFSSLSLVNLSLTLRALAALKARALSRLALPLLGHNRLLIHYKSMFQAYWRLGNRRHGGGCYVRRVKCLER